MAALGLIIMISSVVGTELVLKWNHVSGVYDISSTGQIIPLVVGFGIIANVVWRFIKGNKVRFSGSVGTYAKHLSDRNRRRMVPSLEARCCQRVCRGRMALGVRSSLNYSSVFGKTHKAHLNQSVTTLLLRGLNRAQQARLWLERPVPAVMKPHPPSSSIRTE